MRKIRDFHHYRPEHISAGDNISKLEYHVARLLIENTLGDNKRESSAIFELKHSSNVTQFARLLAPKYEISPTVAAAGALLHDIYVITEGKYKNHAKLGVPIADALLLDHGIKGINERDEVARIVGNHSDKSIYSNDKIIEFGKDIDVLDCFLYPNAIEYYLLNKSFSATYHYMQRAKRMWNSLNLLPDKSLHSLDLYKKNWLTSKTIPISKIEFLIQAIKKQNKIPTFHLSKSGNSKLRITFPKESYEHYKTTTNSNQFTSKEEKYIDEIKKHLHDGNELIIWPFANVYEAIDNSKDKDIKRLSEFNYE